jgi:hypothetical protein
MKLRPPAVSTAPPPDDYIAMLLREQRRQLITPEHEAYIAEQRQLAEKKHE